MTLQTYNKTEYIAQKKEQVKATLEKIVDIFSTKELPAHIANTYLKSLDIPSDKWSLNNRMIMIMIGRTVDARNFNDWKAVGRSIRRGQKAFHIMAPSPYTITEIDEETKQETKKTIMFYKAVPEFSIEQTEGREVKYVEEPKTILPLRKVAEKYGSKVKYDRSFKGEYGSTNGKDIRLCSEDQDVFFHELIHLVEGKLYNDTTFVKGTAKYNEQELIAELGACVLAEIYGFDIKSRAFSYIQGYHQEKSKKQIGELCIKLMKRIENILNDIFEKEISN